MTVRPGSGQGAHDAARIGDTWSLLVGDGPCRRSYEVTFSEVGGALTVHVNGIPVVAERRTGTGPRRGRRKADADKTSGPSTVTAPMPGRVVQVLVAVGDVVAARQGLLVIEAMKMENELRAPRAGTVREIRVAQGATVDAGSVVVVVD